MNLDNEYEASIVDQLLNNECRDFEPPIIGMRVNPVVGGGKIGFVMSLLNRTTVITMKYFRIIYELQNDVNGHKIIQIWSSFD